ncbi:sensor histidine kinase [Thiovibrio sp. JS02]
MKIGQKIIAGFMLITTVSITAGAIGVYVSSFLREHYARTVDQEIPLIEALEEMKHAGLRIVSSTMEYSFIKSHVGGGTREVAEEAAQEEIRLTAEGIAAYEEALRRLGMLISRYYPEKRELVAGIEGAGQELVAASNLLVALIRGGGGDEESIALKEEFEEKEKRYLAVVANALAQEEAVLQDRKGALHASIDNAIAAIVGIALVTALASLLIGVLISRSIARPLAALQTAASDIAQGAFASRVPVQAADEVGRLAVAFNTMAESLAAAREREAQRIRELAATVERLDQEIVSRQRAQEEKEKLAKELREAQKMEAIATMAGGVAHEFNNILAVILGYAELLRHELPQGTALQPDIDEIVKAAARAKELVLQLLSFSRHMEQRRLPVDVIPFIREALQIFKNSVSPAVEIRERIGVEHALVLANGGQIQQVLVNLCRNAVQAMDGQGRIDVLVEKTEIAPGQAGSKVAPGGYLKLAVRDTGRGMAREIQERIFDPFFTTREVGQGAGLGLSVAHGIVSGHGGEIRVESEPGQGAIFTVLLPLLEGAPPDEELSG